ncbi:regulator of chromosome condensation [Fistulifera solaris]|uniref:Regulator of chromosome condensation n=1 Tax=Fistulifera solaris TaxID=1519565 RepID=A0A1Z5K2J3_FISSO|nr:regulator of chromosome condensation [Fistulifera solaris]|eukprot:GAX20487.1 regulator of chromosome condensation [Fistulifera solaris]
MKRAREEDAIEAPPGSFFKKLQQWRALEIDDLFRLNQSVWESCQTPNQIEQLTIQTQQEITRCNDLYATEHGTILVFGDNDNNLLGLPMMDENSEYVETTTPTVLPNVDRVRSVSLGGLHTAALTVDGDVYVWGVADEGALGYSVKSDDEIMPQLVPNLRNILQVKTGDSQTLFLNTQGQVLMCGMIRSSIDEKYHYPAEGRSCRGSNATPVPIQMPGNQKVVRIETGNASNFAAAVLEDGSVVTFGFGEKGELARSRDIAAPEPNGDFNLTEALQGMTEAQVLQHFLTPAPARFAGPVPFPRKEVLSLACGSNHLLVLARNRGGGIPTLYSSGQNSSGQLGLPEEIESVHELTLVREHVGLVAAGPYHSYIVDEDGHLMYACGQNSYAQLGLGHSKSPQFGWQPVAFPEPVLLLKVAAGGSHGMALDANNTLYTWGFNTMGATGHHRAANGEKGGDLLRPTKLNLRSSKKILDFGGGGQHSTVVLSTRDFED